MTQLCRAVTQRASAPADRLGSFDLSDTERRHGWWMLSVGGALAPSALNTSETIDAGTRFPSRLVPRVPSPEHAQRRNPARI
jgi:hypothetical protein